MIDLVNLNPALEVALFGAVLALLAAGGVMWRARRAGLSGWPAWLVNPTSVIVAPGAGVTVKAF